MRKRPTHSPRTIALIAFAAGLTLAGYGVAQELKGIKSLREAPLLDDSSAPDVLKQATPADGFGRAYRQQPPLIPHKVDGYQISMENNQCMNCHDWPGNLRVNAIKISETHYVDRQGARLDKVAGTRYFCLQCHVPQADARPLVGNTFQNATQVQK